MQVSLYNFNVDKKLLILFLGTWCYDSHETELGDKKNHEDKEKSRTPAYDIVSDHYTGIYGSDPGREFAADASVGIQKRKMEFLSDTLFTATSAVCVTGLVVQDTATYWSEFGQVIILLLIQIGGLGVVTVAVSIATIAGRKIGLMQRSTMQEAIAAPKMGGIVRMTTFILKTSFLIELIGAVILFPVFYREFGLGKGIWYAVFHAISAFCNAGFESCDHDTDRGWRYWIFYLAGYQGE